MAFVENWDETTPSNNTNAISIDDEIRKVKTALRERLAVDHNFKLDELTDLTIGKHKTGSARVSVGSFSYLPDNDSDNPGALFIAIDKNFNVYCDTGTEWEITGEQYKVGALYFTTISSNPSTIFGYGTWESFGKGKTLVGLDPTDTDFDMVEETGGEKTHTLITEEMPGHTHTEQRVTGTYTSSGGGSGFHGNVSNAIATQDSGLTGGDQAHNNIPPYVVVYIWKRIS